MAGRIQFPVEVLHPAEMNKNTTHRNQTDVIDTVLQLLLDNDQGARVRLKEGELIPEGFPLLVGSENAEVSDLVSMLVQPRGSGFFESAVEDVPVA